MMYTYLPNKLKLFFFELAIVLLRLKKFSKKHNNLQK